MAMPSVYTMAGEDEQSRLIKANLPLVSAVVERMLPQIPTFLNRDEIKSAAMMGLLDAVQRFDSNRGVLFKTFAEHRIRGAIFDEVRKMDWFSRSLRGKQSRLEQCLGELEVRLGRPPQDDELASEMGMDLEDYHQLLSQVCHLGCVSLHETLDKSEEGVSFLDNLIDDKGKTPEEILQGSELTHELAGYLEKLTEKERLVISLYYYEELNQKEIAEVLEVTEGRVSQLHSQALLKLKVKIRNKRR
ncbi:MAG TPA: FliA/WhiG family RNA polymerase sigma factor [Desulfuromonadales bacterium]|nr:FliA/WhiG family RNA polymerase sigma factor [Desulfuromonadales bacterium]